MKKVKINKESKNKLKDLSSPKGMRDIMNDEYYNFQGFLKKLKK